MRVLVPASKTGKTGTLAFAALAAWLVALGSAGCASSEHAIRSHEDGDLSRRANAALTAAGFDPDRISASSYRGVVALLGGATDGESREAQTILLSVSGVVRVNNMVLTEGSSPAAGFARASGTPWIARARSVPDSKK